MLNFWEFVIDTFYFVGRNQWFYGRLHFSPGVFLSGRLFVVPGAETSD